MEEAEGAEEDKLAILVISVRMVEVEVEVCFDLDFQYRNTKFVVLVWTGYWRRQLD